MIYVPEQRNICHRKRTFSRANPQRICYKSGVNPFSKINLHHASSLLENPVSFHLLPFLCVSCSLSVRVCVCSGPERNNFGAPRTRIPTMLHMLSLFSFSLFSKCTKYTENSSRLITIHWSFGVEICCLQNPIHFLASRIKHNYYISMMTIIIIIITVILEKIISIVYESR